MSRYIDADAFFNDFPELRNYEYASQAYEVGDEPTYEQIQEYCRLRRLTLITNEMFHEMQRMWCTEPRKHGHWDDMGDFEQCSICGQLTPDFRLITEKPYWGYCPNCGARMFDKDTDVPDKNVGKTDEVEE